MEPEHRRSKNQWSPLNWYHAAMYVYQRAGFKVEIPDEDLRELEEMVNLHLDRWIENHKKGEKRDGGSKAQGKVRGAGGAGEGKPVRGEEIKGADESSAVQGSHGRGGEYGGFGNDAPGPGTRAVPSEKEAVKGDESGRNAEIKRAVGFNFNLEAEADQDPGEI